MISNYIRFLLLAVFSLFLIACGGGDGDSARVAQTIDAGVNNIVSIKLDVGVAVNDNYVHAFGKRQYNLTGVDKDNKEVNLNDRASWSISNNSLGSINDKGFFQPNGTAGDFILTVKYSTLTKEVQIMVTDAPLQSIAVSNSATSVDVCKNTTFIGEATFADGLVLNFDLIWSFNDTPSTTLAKFKNRNSPEMSALEDGNVNVIATGQVGTAAPVVSPVFPFTINDNLISIKLTSDKSLSMRSNQTANLKATGVYQDTTESVITTNTSFISDKPDVLTVDASGKRTAKTGTFAGTPVIITATCNERSETLNFTVLKADLTSIVILGPNTTNPEESLSITEGNSLALRIQATLDGGSTEIYLENDVEWAIDKTNSGSFSDSDITIDAASGLLSMVNNSNLSQNITITVTARLKNTNGTTRTNPSGQELKDTVRISVRAS
jgi:hypothetical protein